MFYKQFALHISALLMVSCAGTHQEQSPGNGDLVFVYAGGGDFSDAIATATGEYDHVGIVSVDGEKVTIIDATPKYGVSERLWTDFVVDNPRYDVMAVNGCDVDKAVERAREYVGRPYDFAFAQGDSAIYCSELVQLCYIDSTGRHIFPSKPMNFRSADGQMPTYWVELFDSLGVAIPQGAPGTNPTDLSRHENLKIR